MNQGYRPEIDSLRAVAVIAVIINHLNKGWLPSGYIGVDIFFLISGYVVTGSLYRRKGQGNLIKDFYKRRFKRILPALISMVIITGAVATILATISTTSWRTGITSIFGFSNIYLSMKATDYFAQAIILNPFAHTWSLGVEEQFYLIFPIIVLLTGNFKTEKDKNKFLLVTIIITIISFGIFAGDIYNNIESGYFNIQNRFWEISIGSILFIKKDSIKFSLNKGIQLLIIGLILVVLLMPEEARFITTLIGIIMTSLVLVSERRNGVLYNILTNKRCVNLGKESYSYYLWHWPVISLTAWTLGIHWWNIPIQLLIIIIASKASYKFIENPLRERKKGDNADKIIIKGLCISITASLGMLVISKYGKSLYIGNIFSIDKGNYTWTLRCHGNENMKKMIDPFETCLNKKRSENKTKRIYLIGDSHAAQLKFMLENATKNTEYDVAFISTENYKGDFPYIFWNRLVDMDKVETISNIERVARKGDLVVIAFHKGWLNTVKRRNEHVESKLDNEKSMSIAKENFMKLIHYMDKKEVKIVFVQDVPMMRTEGVEIITCELQRKLLKWDLCEINAELDDKTSKNQDNLFEELTNNKNALKWEIKKYFPIRNNNYTWETRDGVRVYFDQHHITEPFSRSLGKHFKKDILEKIEKKP